jgi:dienelactone hydrolase
MRARVASLVLLLAACGAPAGAPVAPASIAPGAPGTSAVSAPPAVESAVVSYQDGTTELEGYLAKPKDAAKHPAVLVFHDWMGVSADTKKRADQLAALGYVAFAADVYGKGVRPTTAEEAGKLAGRYKSDRALMRSRGEAALKKLVADPSVDATKVAAIGYCFGGTEALELGRDGAPLVGIVSFHGGLSSPTPADGKNIKARVLVLHGADDPFVKPDEVAAFQDEMRQAHVDWQFVAYGGAVHAFTVQGAGSDPSKGAAYDAKADARSWEAMRRFFADLF